MAHAEYMMGLASSVLENLENQHDWKSLQTRTHSSDGRLLPRPLITGVAPKRLYLHPDDQIEMVKTHATYTVDDTPEVEWALPLHVNEKATVKSMAAIFDSIEPVVPLAPGRYKRVLLAVVHNDSTIVYYYMHDGIVKPRQN